MPPTVSFDSSGTAEIADSQTAATLTSARATRPPHQPQLQPQPHRTPRPPHTLTLPLSLHLSRQPVRVISSTRFSSCPTSSSPILQLSIDLSISSQAALWQTNG